MSPGRLTLAILVIALFGVPAVWPVAESVRFAHTLDPARDLPRWPTLAVNSVTLIGGTLVIAGPVAGLLATLLFRPGLPARDGLRAALLAAALLPTPVVVSSWQTVFTRLRVWQPLLTGPATPLPWEPWSRGMGPAVWVHAMLAVPWLAWLVGLALQLVEPELAEEARLHGSAFARLRGVWLPRLGPVLALGLLGVALQAGTEIAVTDVMQVRTFAEEVYTQHVLPDPGEGGPNGSIARATAAGWPAMGLALAAVLLVAPGGARTLAGATLALKPSPPLTLGAWRWPLLLVAAAVVAVVVGVPLGSLLVISGFDRATFRLAAQTHGWLIVDGTTAAVLGGTALATLAVTCHEAGRNPALVRYAAAGTAAMLACLPAPVAGLGLKLAITALADLEDVTGVHVGLADVLYYGPSYAPVMWACALRLWPWVYLLTLPASASLPRDLRDAAALDGRPVAALLPLLWRPVARAGVVVGLLALGEVGAGKLVATASGDSFALIAFARMHYGINAGLAAMCLLQTAAALLAATALLALAEPQRA